MSASQTTAPRSPIRVTRAAAQDLPGILALQEANLHDNLPEPQRAQGFLSARLTAAHFDQIEREVALIVARDDARVAGYLCAATVAFSRQFPVLAAMLERYPHLQYLGAPLDRLNSFVYGPVCIGRDWRGRGLLRAMYDALRAQVAGRFQAGVAFVAQDNPHSLSAHAEGLGMSVIGEFSFNGKQHWILAFGVPVTAAGCGG